MKMENTTIQVQKTTRDLLASIGSKDETFDEIISRLIFNYKQKVKA